MSRFIYLPPSPQPDRSFYGIYLYVYYMHGLYTAITAPSSTKKHNKRSFAAFEDDLSPHRAVGLRDFAKIKLCPSIIKKYTPKYYVFSR